VAEQPPLTSVHIAGRDHPDHTSGQTTKHHKSRPAVQRFAESYVPPLTSAPEPMPAGKDLFNLFRGELRLIEMEDVVIVSVEPRNNHIGRVA
jgi:hypothetical protein